MIGAVLDGVLDRTALGYTSVGYRIRSRGWSGSQLAPLPGRVALVTGATSGLGLAAAEGLARLGATLLLAVRDEERGTQARARIVDRTGNDDVHLRHCDLSRLDSVRELAAAVERVDVLVHNAGVLTRRPERSPDGIELTLATNVVSPFLLTALLAEKLGAGARIVTVSSGGMYTQRLDVEALESERAAGSAAYARTKRAQVVLTELWAQRLAGTDVAVHAMHPGWVDTPGLRASLPRFHQVARPLLRTPTQGADTIVWLGAAAAPGRTSGGFWHDRRRRPTHVLPRTRETPEERVRLWTRCAELSGAEALAAASTSSEPG